jgi:hypothetical protein
LRWLLASGKARGCSAYQAFGDVRHHFLHGFTQHFLLTRECRVATAVSGKLCFGCCPLEKRENAALTKSSETFVFIFDGFTHHCSLMRTRRIVTAVPGKLCVGCWPLQKRDDTALIKLSEHDAAPKQSDS